MIDHPPSTNIPQSTSIPVSTPDSVPVPVPNSVSDQISTAMPISLPSVPETQPSASTAQRDEPVASSPTPEQDCETDATNCYRQTLLPTQ